MNMEGLENHIILEAVKGVTKGYTFRGCIFIKLLITNKLSANND
jgi:hypothetical protein